jgi:hypothetical protein
MNFNPALLRFRYYLLTIPEHENVNERKNQINIKNTYVFITLDCLFLALFMIFYRMWLFGFVSRGKDTSMDKLGQKSSLFEVKPDSSLN